MMGRQTELEGEVGDGEGKTRPAIGGMERGRVTGGGGRTVLLYLPLLPLVAAGLGRRQLGANENERKMEMERKRKRVKMKRNGERKVSKKEDEE